MSEPITNRARWYLAAAISGLLIALGTVPLLAVARMDRQTARTLIDEQMTFESTVSELRALALELQLDAAHLLLTPDDSHLAQANTSRRALLDGEVRRARVHAPSFNAVDILDDFENTSLRLLAATDRINGDGRAVAPVLAAEGAHLNDLSEELTTIAASETAAQAQQFTGRSRPYALMLLMTAALALTFHAVALAWHDSGMALNRRLTALLTDGPGRLRRGPTASDRDANYNRDEPEDTSADFQLSPDAMAAPTVTLPLPELDNGAILLNLRDSAEPGDETGSAAA